MMPIMFMLAAVGMQTTAPAKAPAPSAEAEALGVEVARNGLLVSLLPVLTGKEIDEMIKDHPEMSAAEQDKLRATGRADAQAMVEKLVGTLGHQYALSMSVEDMKAVVAFAKTDASKRWHAAEPGVMMAASKQLEGFDFKGSVSADMCKATGKLCEAKKE